MDTQYVEINKFICGTFPFTIILSTIETTYHEANINYLETSIYMYKNCQAK